MKIGTKLLVTYLAVIGLIGVLATILVPTLVVERTVRDAEQKRLEETVTKQAQFISDRVKASGRPLLDRAATLSTIQSVEELLSDDVALLDDRCIIRRSSRPGLVGKTMENCTSTVATPKTLRRPLAKFEGVGTFIVAQAPLTIDSPDLKGWSLAMIRDVTYIQTIARPIERRIILVLLLGVVFSLFIAGWLSREMVKRLHAAGDAARALAEGDLKRRVPEEGNDEITELAHHFNHMADRVESLVDGLRKSEQARRDLLIIVGHDLRTPMTSIVGFAEALRDGMVQTEEKRHRYYEIIAAEATRLNRLVNDLFDMAKLEAGQLDLRLQAMPVAPWLVEFAEGFAPVAEGAGARIDLAFTPEAERARVYGDRDRLDQVVANLAGNAVRFTPPGGTVLVRASVDGEDLLVEVTDQGPGLPPEDATRVFTRFYQGKQQGNGHHKGAGLGLAIVKSMVEAHGGQVGVRSTPGQGATFWFRLKLVM
jgi:signal transduction histidine kinase